MTPYNPPQRDLRFVIEELIGLEQVSGLDGLEAIAPDLLDAVLEEAGRLAADAWAPHNLSGDLEGCQLRDDQVHTPAPFAGAYQAFVTGGWNGITAPADWGGQALPELLGSAVTELWNAANPSLALCPLLTASATELLARHGDEPLRARYLEKMVTGEWTGTMNLTEPQAGSDLSTVRSLATPEGDHYRLQGQKIYITWGEHALADNIIHLVLARTPDAPPGNRGISLFLVPKYLPDGNGQPGERNDVHCVSIEHKLGIHACPTCTLSYGENGGAIAYRVGEIGRGLNHMFTMMNEARHKIGLQAIGIADRAWQQARSFAAERIQGRLPDHTEPVAIIEHPDVRRMLMGMRAQTEAMRALALVNATAMDRARHSTESGMRDAAQRRVDLLTPLVKAIASDWAIEVTSTGIQVHGGMGYVEETGAAQFLRDARIAPIYEGTNGIQAQDFTLRKVLKDGGTALRELLAEVAETAAAADAESRLADLGAALGEALSGLQTSTEHLLNTAEHGPRGSLAAATPFMHQVGIVLGGWLMLRAALIALAQIDNGSSDPFYPAKVATARFYATHVLPRAEACRPAVTGADTSLDGLNDVTV
ncbi:MAG: acyl-CoA dehydrogenase [Spiribacter sp.]|nr:acyl-CoA dehydrogenase [Spiribacter sp.]MDR9455692.1 acyl-CoA dehydrogenase [Spiribacter sp.]